MNSHNFSTINFKNFHNIEESELKIICGVTRDDYLKENGVKAMLNYLHEHPEIKSLDISNSIYIHLDKHTKTKVMELIANYLATNNTITSFNISKNDIGITGAEILARGLATNTTITSLNVSRNNIGGQGCRAIINYLANNRTLTSLDISMNAFHIEKIEALIEILSQNPILTSLNLRGNILSYVDIYKIAKYLETNKTLTSLDISNNDIDNSAAYKLVKSLPKNTTLKFLNLANNPLEEAVTTLVYALANNESLTSLDISHTSIANSEFKIIAAGLVNNKTLKLLNIGCINFKKNKDNFSLIVALKKLTSIQINWGEFSKKQKKELEYLEKNPFELQKNIKKIYKKHKINYKNELYKPDAIDENPEAIEAYHKGLDRLVAGPYTCPSLKNLCIFTLEKNQNYMSTRVPQELQNELQHPGFNLFLNKNKTELKFKNLIHPIEKDDIELIFDYLEKNPTITSLDLSENDSINEEKLKIITKRLSTNKSLLSLHIHNKIANTESAKLLAKWLNPSSQNAVSPIAHSTEKPKQTLALVDFPKDIILTIFSRVPKDKERDIKSLATTNKKLNEIFSKKI